MEAILPLGQLMKKMLRKEEKVDMVSINLKKPSGRVLGNLIWQILDENSLPRGYIDFTKNTM